MKRSRFEVISKIFKSYFILILSIHCFANQPEDALYFTAVSDSAQGFYIVWQDTVDNDLYVQRYAHNLQQKWTDSVKIVNTDISKVEMAAADDGENGVVIIWSDQRDGISGDIYGQRVDKNGQLLWQDNGKEIIKSANYQGKPAIVRSDQNSLIIVWQDQRDDPDSTDLYCQKLDTDGNALWPSDLKLEVRNNIFKMFRVVGDKQGGLYVAWREKNSSNKYTVKLHKINSNGTLTWSDPINLISDKSSEPQFLNVLNGDETGVTIVWSEAIGGYLGREFRVNADGLVGYSYNFPSNIFNTLLGLKSAFTNSGGYIRFFVDYDGGATYKWSIGRVDASPVLIDEKWTQSFTRDSSQVKTPLLAMNVLSNGNIVAFYHDSTTHAIGYDISGLVGWTRDDLQFNLPARIVGDGDKMTFIITGYQSDQMYRLNVDGTNVPVELSNFYARKNHNTVSLIWETSSESNNFGFEIYRRYNEDVNWNKVGFVKGSGTTNKQKRYQFVDDIVSREGIYYYQLKQVDYDGSYTFSDYITVTLNAPEEFHLSQNYPNPFNPSTTINFKIPVETELKLVLYDVTGKMIKVLEKGNFEPGYYKIDVVFDNIPTGIYFYSLEAKGYKTVKKMTFLR